MGPLKNGRYIAWENTMEARGMENSLHLIAIIMVTWITTLYMMKTMQSEESISRLIIITKTSTTKMGGLSGLLVLLTLKNIR